VFWELACVCVCVCVCARAHTITLLTMSALHVISYIYLTIHHLFIYLLIYVSALHQIKSSIHDTCMYLYLNTDLEETPFPLPTPYTRLPNLLIPYLKIRISSLEGKNPQNNNKPNSKPK
jgi:hypothetical protein